MVMNYKPGQVWEVGNPKGWTITITEVCDGIVKYYWDGIPTSKGKIMAEDLDKWSMKKRPQFSDYYEQL